MAEGIRNIGHTITPDDLAKMGPNELREYIHRRLLKLELNPPAPAAQETEPEDFFLAVFKIIPDAHFQRRFADQTARLIFDADLISHSEYLSRLFHLVEMLDLHETAPAFYFLLGRRKQLEQLSGYYEPNLFAVLLRIMVRFDEGDGLFRVLWETLLWHADYAPIAYNAIIRQNPRRALDYLVQFTETAIQHPQKINYSATIRNLSGRAAEKDWDEFVPVFLNRAFNNELSNDVYLTIIRHLLPLRERSLLKDLNFKMLKI